MSIMTACPLDCYDSCKIEYIDGKLKGAKTHPITQGYLCKFMDKFQSYPRIKQASYMGKPISLDEALEILAQKIKEYQDMPNLYFQGSGNLALMQSIPKLFFDKAGFDCARGSLCDGAGNAGIVAGRGANLTLPYSQIEKSDVVILWGRNPANSNKHLLPFLKDKTLIVIDPIKTEMAKKADIFMQIKPRSDIFLAMMLSRLALINDVYDEDFCQNMCENFDDFQDVLNSYPLVGLEKLSEVSLLQANALIDTIKGKKVSILVGIGVQKYKEGADVLRFIDSFGATMGLFGKEGCGVSYLGDSSFGIANPFKTSKKSAHYKATVDFSKFGVVFISNANPLRQKPDKLATTKSFDEAKFRVYFGLYENETSKASDLIIPAASFLEKADVKSSYSHEYIFKMPKILDNQNALSEYELTQKMSTLFGFEPIEDEQNYLEMFTQNIVHKDGEMINAVYEKIPYSDGFYTSNKKFLFIDEFEPEVEDSESFYLLCSRQTRSLNSQFECDDRLYIPPSLGYNDGDRVTLTSRGIEGIFEVKNHPGLREDCTMINSGAKEANLFTKSILSYEGNMALYQDFKVNIK
jgi:anaerobic selenocysteine-containing dehydrogenase